MHIVIMIAQLLAGLSFLVFIHELGHFLAARAFHIRVDKFYLFFDAYGFKLFSFHWKGTEFGIGWLPIGGYCKIHGMVDESMDRDTIQHEPEPDEYRAKPTWQRLIVITAGVFLNLLLGLLIFSLQLLSPDSRYLPTSEVNRHGGLYAGPYGREIGLKNGDLILGVNGKQQLRFEDILGSRTMLGGTLNIQRKGQNLNITIPDTTFLRLKDGNGLSDLFFPNNYPVCIEALADHGSAQKSGLQIGMTLISLDSLLNPSFGAFRDYLGQHRQQEIPTRWLLKTDTLNLSILPDSNGHIGIQVKAPFQYQPYRFTQAFRYGIGDAFELLSVNARGLGQVITGKIPATESIQGPIAIAGIYGSELSWARFWFITGLLSLILAFMNILPIPALDGGHMIFVLYEMISRRKPSIRVMEISQVIGMIILFALMFFAVSNDILRLFR